VFNRQYQVRSPRQPASIEEGSFSFGAFDAAVAYARKYLPGYEVIPRGRVGRFEAIHHADQVGAVIYVENLG